MTQADHDAFTRQTLNEALGIIVTDEGNARLILDTSTITAYTRAEGSIGRCPGGVVQVGERFSRGRHVKGSC